jgi:hypothetical protein
MARKKSKDEMKCNKPEKSWRAGKKKVVKGCQDGKEKIVHYGDSNYSDYTKHKDKDRRANFRARHNCSEQKDKLSAAYWACRDLW